jgi:hypothetical protein
LTTGTITGPHALPLQANATECRICCPIAINSNQSSGFRGIRGKFSRPV